MTAVLSTPIVFPLWKVIVVTIYVLVAHTYVTWRLIDYYSESRFAIWLALIFTRLIKTKQHQRVDDKEYHRHNAINNILLDMEKRKQFPNKDTQNESTNEKGYHIFPDSIHSPDSSTGASDDSTKNEPNPGPRLPERQKP